MDLEPTQPRTPPRRRAGYRGRAGRVRPARWRYRPFGGHFARTREAGDHSQSRRSERAGRPPNRDLRGSRDSLRPLFELAEDSAAELDAYIDAGRVLVATSDREIIGHLQLTGTGDPRQAEIKNMAVRENRQGQGIGRRLIQAAIELAAAESVTTILVATAAADIGNLRFYQRQGFRMRSVERDAFTPATGYPPGLLIDGIELRDRVWLDRVVLGEWPIFQVRMRV
jgi:GNAT superfamily N-acetyltransferase